MPDTKLETGLDAVALADVLNALGLPGQFILTTDPPPPTGHHAATVQIVGWYLCVASVDAAAREDYRRDVADQVLRTIEPLLPDDWAAVPRPGDSEWAVIDVRPDPTPLGDGEYLFSSCDKAEAAAAGWRAGNKVVDVVGNLVLVSDKE